MGTHSYSLVYCLGLLLYSSGRVNCVNDHVIYKPKIYTLWPFTEEVCQHLLSTYTHQYAHNHTSTQELFPVFLNIKSYHTHVYLFFSHNTAIQYLHGILSCGHAIIYPTILTFFIHSPPSLFFQFTTKSRIASSLSGQAQDPGSCI